MNKLTLLSAVVVTCSLQVGCTDGVEPSPVVDEEPQAQTAGPGTPELGDPLPGLTPDQLAAFERGREVFNRRFKPSEGLGPFYNATSCQSCHSTPVSGGGAELYRNFYIAMVGTPPFQSPIPPGISAVIPSFGDRTSLTNFTLEGGRTIIPDDYLGFIPVVAQRNAIPIFGVGLFELISDATILANADPDDADQDGISGRYNTDFGALGRFGVKAQSNAIEFFTRGPLNNQMGITSDPFEGSAAVVSLCSAVQPIQVSSDPDTPTTDLDGVPDPEISHDDLGDLIAFSKFLAPPAKKPFDADAIAGEQLFDQIGCTKCHLPSLASSRGPVEAYTDLLIHDMGPDLADGLSFGLPQASAISPPDATSEFRTQPLWGVSGTGPFLHDGRAETLREAIVLHGGEGQASRDAFLGLTVAERGQIITFLEHL